MSVATWDDFERLGLRVGRIERAEPSAKARKPSYKLWIDFGPLGVKQSSAQIVDRYGPQDLVGRLVIAVTNFAPKIVAGFRSEVLVLGAVPPEAGVVLLGPDMDVAPGTRVA